MLLYKYKSLDKLWHILDIVINQRLYCAHWSELNDPLEGRYSFFFKDGDHFPEKTMRKNIDSAKEAVRISALSKNHNNFLLWSHYANGHKGVAIEIEIPEESKYLQEVIYTPFDVVFTNEDKIKDVNHIFKSKTEEWKYEEEYRIILNDSYFSLPIPVKTIYLGALVSNEHEKILYEILPPTVEIIKTSINYYQGWVE